VGRNACQLDSAGVPRENMEFAGICTMCRTDLFYSFRREGEGCGHFGLLAALRAG
jgi:copper oxidase (laccase) domain-containing protein